MCATVLTKKMFLKEDAIPNKEMPIDTPLYAKETFTLKEKFSFVHQHENRLKLGILAVFPLSQFNLDC